MLLDWMLANGYSKLKEDADRWGVGMKGGEGTLDD